MPDNQNIFFSIIVPVFNLENYIERAITSILNQSFQDFELIIVNDGSIDNTADIINKYSRQNPKITVIIHQKNESLHIARMDGVAAANGEYVLFLDGDDYFIENALSILYDEIQKNPGYDFYEYGYIRQPSGESVFPFYSGTDRFSDFFDNKNHPVSTMWNKVYDTVLIKKSFASMERIYINNAEDKYESIVIAFFQKKTLRIEKIIVNYQIGDGISTTYKDYNKTIELLQSIQTMNKLIEVFLQNNNLKISLERLNYRFLTYTTNNHIIPQKNEIDMKKLFLILPDYFDVSLIMEYFFFREKEYKEILSIIDFNIDSKYFKYFINILKLLHKVKNLFIKNKRIS